jgi:hypothetical protein
LSFLAERFGQRAAAEQQVDIRLEEVSDELRVIERQLKQQHRADQKDRKTAEMSESETYFGRMERSQAAREIGYRLTVENLKPEPVRLRLVDAVPMPL